MRDFLCIAFRQVKFLFRDSSFSSAFIDPLLDVGLSSDIQRLPIQRRTDPVGRCDLTAQLFKATTSYTTRRISSRCSGMVALPA